MNWRDVREYVESVAIAIAIAALARLVGIQAPEWMRPYALAVCGAITIGFLVMGLVLGRRHGR